MKTLFSTKHLLIIFFLFLLAGFLYNKDSDILAQELQCENPEIPVGFVTDQSVSFAQELSLLIQTISVVSFDQTEAAEALLELTDRYEVGNCSAECTPECLEYECIPVYDPCESEDEDGNCIEGTSCDRGSCIDSECNISECSGDPGPSFETSDRLETIERAYQQIKNIKDAVLDLLDKKEEYSDKPFCPPACGSFTKKELIEKLMEEARKGLSACVTPSNFYEGEEVVQNINILLSCQEGRYQRILTDEQEECYVNNFFCCIIK